MPPIRFGAFLMPHPPEEQFAIARRVDALGFDSIWTGDHVSFHHPLYESLTLLASYIGITSRVKLGVGVYLLALRHPTVAAMITSTLYALSDAALARAGRLGDGWISYVVQPERYKQSLAKIEAAASAAGRSLEGFAKGHLTFITLGKDYESAERVWVERLSQRYAQDFVPLAKKYGIIGTPDQCAEQLQRYIEAGCTYFVLDAICDAADEARQIET